jgi:hypothetical protein
VRDPPGPEVVHLSCRNRFQSLGRSVRPLQIGHRASQLIGVEPNSVDRVAHHLHGEHGDCFKLRRIYVPRHDREPAYVGGNAVIRAAP